MELQPKATGITWEELLDEYFFARNLRSATEWSYSKVVVGFIRFIGEAKCPGEITRREILQWRRVLLKERNLSTHTWNNKVAHLRALFNFGINEQLFNFDKNPLTDCAVQKDRKKKKTLNKQQLTRIYLIMQQFGEDEAMCRSGEGRRRCALYPVWFWLAVLDTLRYTGMRLNQLLHIRLRDINNDEGFIELQLDGSKTHREWRVPIVRQLKHQLQRLIMRTQQSGAESSDFVFDVRRFTPGYSLKEYQYDADNALQSVRSFFSRLSKECGFAVSPHRFRHTLATELMKAPDRNLQLVRELLGHRSVTTTMEYIDMKMDIIGRTLENELALHTDICVEVDLYQEGLSG